MSDDTSKHREFCSHLVCSLHRSREAWREAVAFQLWVRGRCRVAITDTHTGATTILEPRRAGAG